MRVTAANRPYRSKIILPNGWPSGWWYRCNFTSNSLLNSHQSAYCKRHSTETAPLYIHDHLVNAIGSQKVSCLCLLDLSAAFDTIQSINQSCFFRVVQVTKSLQDPLEVGNSLPGISDNVREWGLEQKCFKRRRKADRDGADNITLSGRLFQMVGPATGKAWPPTVDSFTSGTSRRLVRAERRERRPGRSVTRTSWLRYDGAVPWVASCVIHSCR